MGKGKKGANNGSGSDASEPAKPLSIKRANNAAAPAAAAPEVKVIEIKVVPNKKPQCKWGAECHNNDPQHLAKFEHPPRDQTKSAPAPKADKKPQCKWGAECHNTDPHHLAKFEHPPRDQTEPAPASKETKTEEKKPQCKWGAECHNTDPHHLAKFEHPPRDPSKPAPAPKEAKSDAAKGDGKKPVCKFGLKCNRTDAEHLARFEHPHLKAEASADATENKVDAKAPEEKVAEKTEPESSSVSVSPAADENSNTSTPHAESSSESSVKKKGKLLDDDVCTKAVIPKDTPPSSWATVTLETNYFRVRLGSSVHEYAATFNPSLEDSPKRRILIRKKKIPSEILLMGNCLYTSAIIPDDQLEWTVTAREAGMSHDVTVTLSLVKTFSKGTEVPPHVFAALFQQSFLSAGYRHIQRNFFDYRRMEAIPGGKYNVIPGVEVAVVPAADNGWALVADVTNKVARNGTILGALQDSRNRFALDNLKGCIVYTDYNNRSYTVKAICSNMSPASTFKLDDGTSISYARYVKNKYGKTISTEKQPMIECVRRGESVFLIPEFCHMTGIDEMDRRDFQMMSEITKKLFPDPRKRQDLIGKEVGIIKKNTNMVDLSIADPSRVQANIIQCPKVLERASLHPAKTNTADMSGKKPMKTLAIVHGDRFNAGQLCRVVEECFSRFGMDRIKLREISLNPHSFAKDLEDAHPDFALFVLFNKNDYAKVKMLCTHKLKVPSQVVTERNVSNPKRMVPIVHNVVRQMTAKLGNCPWVMPFNPITKGTMVFGLDVCHTTPIHKSVVGMVASLDDTFGRYISDFIVQDRGKEIVGDLKPFVKKALEKFKKRNGAFPKNVLFLRDGVGDGQLMYVNDVELTSVQDSIKAICPQTNLTYVVVKKRIRTRLFNSGRNPLPGTVVDSTITHPKWYDFFLVSHQTPNGTVSPTHYNVLFDAMRWPKSELQLFVYLLCYQYYNWDGSISVPAPCQYAHKMAFLYGKTLLSSANNVPSVPAELEDTLLQI